MSQTSRWNKSLLDLPGVREELEEQFRRQGVTAEGRQLVLDAFEGPERRTRSGGGNVCVRYASRKMKRVIQCESRNVELAFVERCEFDPEVLFYVCQPAKLLVRREDVKGRMKGNWVTPDYLVVSREGMYLVECKPLSVLRRDLTEPNPKFFWDGSNWRYPAAEVAAAELGLGFRVFSSEKVNPTWHRNMRFLADFLEVDCPDPDNARALVKEVSKAGSMRIGDVLALPDVKAEVLWWLIAQDAVWADLEFELLRDGEMSSVYSSKARMIANRHWRAPVGYSALSHRVNTVRLDPGSRLFWNGTPYTVLNRTPEDVVLHADVEGGKNIVVSMETLREFLASGAISGEPSEAIDSILRQRQELLIHASEKALKAANQCHDWLIEYWQTGKAPAGVSLRSIRRYAARYRMGERVYGCGFYGLIPQRGRRRGKRDLGERQQQVLDEVVKTFVKDESAGHLSNAYGCLKALCEERGISPAPCKETLRLALKRKRKRDVVLGREGKRAAYQVSGPLVTEDPVIPRVGDRVWQVAHVDHLLVKVELVSGDNGAPLGKAWLTLMIDDRSRMPLGLSFSFDEPSRVAVLGVLHDCVRRHNRLPDNIVVDQGPEFHSIDVEGAFASLEINKVERPAAKPRFGAVIERMFGTLNARLIHELPGNVKRAVHSRNQSRTHDPKRNAKLSLRGLHEILEEWLFDEYPDLIHKSLGETTPRKVFAADLVYSGERAVRYVANDESLRMLLAATPERPTRRVANGGIISVDYLRYHHEALLAGDVVGSNVAVKLDTQDCSVVYAWVRGEWVPCRLTDGNADLAGRSWKEVRLLIEELRQRYRTGAKGAELNAAKIGRYFRKRNYGEKVARQVEREKEARSISREEFMEMEGEVFLHEEEFSEVPVYEMSDASANDIVGVSDCNDVLEGAKSLRKVVRK